MNSLPRPSFSPDGVLATLFRSLLHHIMTARLRLTEFVKGIR